MHDEETKKAFFRLYEITRTLRSEHGCPWDKNQTPLALRGSLLEESFEAVDAITSEDVAHVCEELGDVLFNVLLIARMYEQQGDFTLAQSLDAISEKLIRRHPHVFAPGEGTSEMHRQPQSSAEVLAQWDVIKERLEGRKGDSVLDTVPQGFPPLLRAYTLTAKAAKKHFTWVSAEQARQKLAEELCEVQAAADEVARYQQSQEAPFTLTDTVPPSARLHLEEEIGDALFALANYARLLGVDPTVALSRTNQKFYKRFTFVEREMQKSATPMDENHLSDMCDLWRTAKSL